jgi:hypothetical protein
MVLHLSPYIPLSTLVERGTKGGEVSPTFKVASGPSPDTRCASGEVPAATANSLRLSLTSRHPQIPIQTPVLNSLTDVLG